MQRVFGDLTLPDEPQELSIVDAFGRVVHNTSVNGRSMHTMDLRGWRALVATSFVAQPAVAKYLEPRFSSLRVPSRLVVAHLHLRRTEVMFRRLPVAGH